MVGWVVWKVQYRQNFQYDVGQVTICLLFTQIYVANCHLGALNDEKDGFYGLNPSRNAYLLPLIEKCLK